MTAARPRGLARFPPLAALRHPGFRLLTLGTAPAMIAMQMSMVAFGYLAYELSGSATALGVIGLGWGIPLLVLSLAGGVIADRLPRRAILLGTQAVVGAAALLGAILVSTGLMQVWHLFVMALLQGTAFAFNMPARQALVADLVGPADLGNAIAVNNAVMNLTRVVGPPIAGFLIGAATIGISGVFVIMVLMYVLVLLIFTRLPHSQAPPHAPGERRSGWQDLLDGLRFIKQSPVLLGFLLLAFAAALLGMPHQLLMPAFALGVFAAGPQGLGVLGMASGLGALGGSVAITVLPETAPRRLLQSLLGIAFGAGLVVFAVSGALLPATLALAVTSAAAAAFTSINMTLIMQAAPPALHGRVMSVVMMTFALMPLTSLPAARLTDIIGAPMTVGGMGVLLVLAIGATSLWLRRQRPQPARAPATAD